MQTISTNNLNQARKLIQKIRKENPNEEIAVRAQDDEFTTLTFIAEKTG